MDIHNMKRSVIPLITGCALSLSTQAVPPQTEHYIVTFPEGTRVSYSGAFASSFPDGLPVCVGSGLLFTGRQGDTLNFVTVTDRGPIADRMPTRLRWESRRRKFSSRQTLPRC